MKAFYLFLVLVLFPSTTFTNNLESDKKINGFKKVVHYLLPFTDQDQLIPCDNVFNVKTEFEKSLSCNNKKVFPKKQLKEVNIPACYIVSKKSPDVNSTKVYNYINTSLIIETGIVGFYEDTTKTIYLIENYDAPMIWRHELGHYFLDLIEKKPDGAHAHDWWKKCEPARYIPSKESIEHSK